MRIDKMAEERKQRNRQTFFRVLAVIYAAVFVAFAAVLIRLDVLPARYLWSIIVVLAAISAAIAVALFRGKKRRRLGIAAACFAIILIIVYGVGIYYMASTLNFIDEITTEESEGQEETGTTQVMEDYYVVVSDTSGYTDIEDISGEKTGTYAITDEIYSEAKTMLLEVVDTEYCYIDDLEELFIGLPGEYEAVLISAATYELLTSERGELTEDTTVIYILSVPVEKKSSGKRVDVTCESFNIYVSGLDVQGSITNVSRSDANMIVTVNPVTRDILITSIPRDYYVNLPSKNAMDKLTHSGLYGIEETIGAAEEMLGLDINYYVKVNYTTVVELVDAIGGIDIYSPYTFTTHKMQELSGITFYEGPNHLNGNMALAYCRERASFSSGDMQRNENQQLILSAIIEKCTESTTILSNYTSILDAVGGNMETNFTEDEITSLIRMQLDDMTSWNISQTALKGNSTSGFCYALGQSASVVAQDQELIVETADLIVKTMTDGLGDTDENTED